MRRQHQGGTSRYFTDIVDEDHPLGPELVHHMLIVDDLVIAVHRRLEDPDHPGQGFDGLLHPRTEAPRFSQEHTFDGHGPRLPGRPP